MNRTGQGELFQVSGQIAWENAGPGIQRQVFGHDNNIMLVKVKFEKDAVGTLHEHEHIQVSYVESGMFELTIGDKKQMLNAGDGYYVPPHVLHGCVCKAPGILIDVFTPAREDFLENK